ncbi:MAG TPA: isoprenylcysteine carboxylmethyltransferase family protein [Anaerolineae bacterium]|nr:isoprenylcysteine carboxylmethyltransferase family protein [Anaerolineae bacterium]
MAVAKLVTFLLATAGLGYVSRAWLVNPRSHGFYRFFSWEAILVLGLLNMELWFRDPFSWHQIISWCFLAVSGYLVIHSVHLLWLLGKPSSKREGEPLFEFEKTTRLVTVGIYRYIRHPMYSSLLFLAWGVFFKKPSWAGGLLAVVATLFLVAAGKIEEAEDIRYFGEAYREYIKRTKMFIPALF